MKIPQETLFIEHKSFEITDHLYFLTVFLPFFYMTNEVMQAFGTKFTEITLELNGRNIILYFG